MEKGVGESSLEQYDKETQCSMPSDYSQVLTLIKTRVLGSFSSEPPLIEHPETCSKCSISPILGIKYECTQCVKYYLCEKCELQRHEHPMYMHKKLKSNPPQEIIRKIPDLDYKNSERGNTRVSERVNSEKTRK
ncbi:hypothetical protein SteCoe_22690 [Stentor coeruleus]|uniref:ZZ-type domain-containing protein n=1 Tax=Stentor coeruleus TaxID=5963 RepID=A0A1R2BLK2_9CILI|nr:hypothetical protein SteCoe_22690 [Stentor coeruleus]